MSALNDNRTKRTRDLARKVLSGAGLFEVAKLKVSYWCDRAKHILEVETPGYRMQVSELSSLDLPSYPEIIEAAYDHQVRHAPKPPRSKKR